MRGLVCLIFLFPTSAVVSTVPPARPSGPRAPAFSTCAPGAEGLPGPRLLAFPAYAPGPASFPSMCSSASSGWAPGPATARLQGPRLPALPACAPGMASSPGEPVRSVCAAGLVRLTGDVLGSKKTARGPVTGLGVAGVLVPSLGRATGVAQRWGWPVEGVVVRRFTVGPHPWSPGHRGVDIAAEAGVPVRAAGDGIVHFAGWVVSRPVVSVAHSNGTRTTYEPVEPSVTAGQTVVTGQIIGVLLTGHDGALHFGLRQGETYLDPLVLLGRGRVRLLPLARPASRRRAGRSPQPCCRSAHSIADSRDHETA